MKQRIQKVLASAGVASRRSIEAMVREGRIDVNGKTMTTLPIMVDLEHDRITVDGELVKRPAPRTGRGPRRSDRLYILLYKPKGVHCTNAAQGEQTRAIDLLPPNLGVRVYPVGRLDAQSKGLLLMTNDGDLTNRLTHPRYGVPKTYRVVADGLVSDAIIEEISHGVWLTDHEKKTSVKTAPCEVKIVNRDREKSVLELTLREKGNHEVRRMLAKLGHKVRELTRVRMGTLTLKGLAPGQSRLLTVTEVRKLSNSPAPSRPPPSI